MVIGVSRFGTLEWWKDFENVWNSDETILSALKGFSFTAVYKMSDAPPDMKPIFQKTEDGKVVETRYVEPSDETEYVFEAKRDVWKGLLMGQINPTMAMLKKDLAVKGSWGKLMKRMKGFSRLLELLKVVETEW